MESSSKKLLLIAVVAILAIVAGGYYYLYMPNKAGTTTNLPTAVTTDNAQDAQTGTDDEGVSVTTDKKSYKRGEDIKFTITNNTQDALWYVVPASKCGKDFYAQLSRQGANNEWADRVVVWLMCGDQQANANSFKVEKLEPGKSLEQTWNQDIFVQDAGKEVTLKMMPGVYKMVFSYSGSEYDLAGLPPLDVIEDTDFLPQQATSEGFEVEDDGTLDLATKKAKDALRKSELDYINSKLISYFDDHNSTYPKTGDKMVKLNDTSSAVYKELVPEYLTDDFLKDPNDPNAYYGYKSVDGKDFELTAVLENKDDDKCAMAGNICIYKMTSSGVVSKK